MLDTYYPFLFEYPLLIVKFHLQKIRMFSSLYLIFSLMSCSCLTTANEVHPLILSLLNNFINFRYPKDKLEWIIIDDGTDPIEDLVISIPQVKYFYVKDKVPSVVNLCTVKPLTVEKIASPETQLISDSVTKLEPIFKGVKLNERILKLTDGVVTRFLEDTVVEDEIELALFTNNLYNILIN